MKATKILIKKTKLTNKLIIGAVTMLLCTSTSVWATGQVIQIANDMADGTLKLQYTIQRGSGDTSSLMDWALPIGKNVTCTICTTDFGNPIYGQFGSHVWSNTYPLYPEDSINLWYAFFTYNTIENSGNIYEITDKILYHGTKFTVGVSPSTLYHNLSCTGTNDIWESYKPTKFSNIICTLIRNKVEEDRLLEEQLRIEEERERNRILEETRLEQQKNYEERMIKEEGVKKEATSIGKFDTFFYLKNQN